MLVGCTCVCLKLSAESTTPPTTGTQPAVNLHQWMTMKTASWALASTLVSEELVLKAYQDATTSMSTLNQQAARLMHKHG